MPYSPLVELYGRFGDNDGREERRETETLESWMECSSARSLSKWNTLMGWKQ